MTAGRVLAPGGRLVARALLPVLAAALTAFALTAPAQAAEQAGERILYVDSYHEGYEWSDGILAGIKDILGFSKVELKVEHMDAKRQPSEAHARAEALRIKDVIEEYLPDALIVSDDVAAQYLVQPYYRGSDLPVVFCGLNWDASACGFPASNITGMVEVDLVREMVELLRPYARGVRTGYISGDTAVDRKITAIFNERFFSGSMKVYAARTMAEFKALYLQAQDEVDILFVRNYAGIVDWDAEEARRFVQAKTRIPTGAHNPWMAPYALVTLAKAPEEQGQWAAETALRIISGVPASSIALAVNTRARLTINLRLADAMGLFLDPALLEAAEIIGP